MRRGWGRQAHKREVVDGHKFDSGAEVRRYMELKAKLAAGEIGFLEVHPKFILLPKYVDYSGRKWGAIKFTPDFKYETSAGVQVVEDVKGVQTYHTKKRGIRKTRLLVTRDYILRKAMFVRQYPGIEFREVAT